MTAQTDARAPEAGMDTPASPLSHAAFALRVLIALGLGVLFLALWQIHSILLLVFGAIVIATILDAGARPLQRFLPGSRGVAVIATALILLVAAGLLVWLFGLQISNQLTGLVEGLTGAWQTLNERIRGTPLAAMLPGEGGSLPESSGASVGRIFNLTGTLMNTVVDVTLVVFGGVYLALQPSLYREGLLKLVPGKDARERGREAMNASGRALRLWLIAKLISMLTIGLLAGIGCWLLGLPTPLGIGLFAGIVSFIPLVGAVAGAVPALLLASGEGWSLFLWTALLFFGIQQIEGQLILPLAQRYTVSLPPALTLFAIVTFGILFGFAGVAFAAPLTVVSFVLVKALWVENALQRETHVPGRDDREDA